MSSVDELNPNMSMWELLQFSEKDERHKMMACVIGLTLAWQIRAMREQRGWTQTELAERMGTHQHVVSRLENPETVLRTTIKTLLRVAQTFDVALITRFESWRDWMQKMLGDAAFAPPPYSAELLPR